MPLVTITSLKGRTKEEKSKIGDVIQKALVEVGVPPTDRFQRFFDMNEEDFIYDRSYPDMPEERTEKFIMIEILLSVGRSVKIKRKLLETLISGLGDLSIDPKDVFVVFKETAWENWAFTAGNILHI
ncbi:Tautomerase enzyme [Mucilaginibacter mallensis]|uniref:Tautomerase enzyme n=1 Tax=Mucilaginibacter mallensis TaxID=652787 RepID=A0A1H1U307_MUCMA|nr:tautomerase family protein [Mucilaginibacter mallensis]SDS66900.1 Tautomerase enzyme [Mucilaginibacter mallensis]